SLSAYEYKNKDYPDARTLLRRHLDQELFVGVEELHGLAKTSIDNHSFYYFETRSGVEQHAEIATELSGYVLVGAVRANDPAVVKALISSLYQLHFFPPSEALHQAGPNAAPYEGPALSSRHLQALKDAAPAE